MKDYTLDDARSEYFAGGYVFPTVAELKQDGRWERMNDSEKAWYQEDEKYKQDNPELAARSSAFAAKYAARFGLR